MFSKPHPLSVLSIVPTMSFLASFFFFFSGPHSSPELPMVFHCCTLISFNLQFFSIPLLVTFLKSTEEFFQHVLQLGLA